MDEGGLVRVLGAIKKHITTHPARATYEFIVLAAAVLVMSGWLIRAGWGPEALVFPVFVVLVAAVLILVSGTPLAGRNKSRLAKTAYAGFALSFFLMSIVLVLAVADAVSGKRLQEWIPKRESGVDENRHLSQRFFNNQGNFRLAVLLPRHCSFQCQRLCGAT